MLLSVDSGSTGLESMMCFQLYVCKLYLQTCLVHVCGETATKQTAVHIYACKFKQDLIRLSCLSWIKRGSIYLICSCLVCFSKDTNGRRSILNTVIKTFWKQLGLRTLLALWWCGTCERRNQKVITCRSAVVGLWDVITSKQREALNCV